VIGTTILGLLLASGGARAGTQAPAPDQATPGADRPARVEAFRMVDAYVMSNLQESLGLTDDQFAKAVPLVKKLQTERREYLLKRTQKVREMRGLLHQGGASEAQVVELLREVKALDAEGPTATRRNVEALDAVLTPIQQAKFRVLELEVELRMRELVRRAGPRGGGRSPRE
jgi:Spy/CpxP family protein refolding chaperone